MDFSRRRREAELMDQPGLDPAEHRQALHGLRTINRFSRSAAIVWRPIRRLLRELRDERISPPGPLRILDVASGGGDVTLGVALRAKSAGLDVRVDGCDISRVAVDHASRQAQAAQAGNVGFILLDALHEPLPGGYDVVMCSLFLHHLDQPEALLLLRKMAAAARRLVLVNDLRRSRWGYALAWLGSRLLTRSQIVHVDGPLSVAGAFTVDEARELAQTAGLEGATISRHWPQRWLLSWRRA